MQEVSRLRAKRQVTEALRQRNGPQTSDLHDLPINSEVLVWRENGEWSGPFKLLSMEGETCRVQLPSGPTDFRSTSVRPYLREHQEQQLEGDPAIAPEYQKNEESPIEDAIEGPTRRNPTRERRLPSRFRQNLANLTIAYVAEPEPDIEAFVSGRFEWMTLDKKPDFTKSRQKELDDLLQKGVFQVVSEVPKGARLFGSRFVDEIKNWGTDKAFEKSRLVIQAYNDIGKKEVLTQSPTIQRASQRLILCLATLIDNTDLYLRDISQAYVQSTTSLNRDFYVKPPQELKLQKGSILKVVKPLYGIPEAGNHWFKTYYQHHLDNLHVRPSTYDPCLLYVNDFNPNKEEQGHFAVVGLQTDDSLFLANQPFVDLEGKELGKAKLLSKPLEKLTVQTPLMFNGGLITITKINNKFSNIELTQERQASRIKTVPISADKRSEKNEYVAQRARGAYIATICQPEAAFDLSYAAQATDIEAEDVKALNKRLQWQIDNKGKGLHFVKLQNVSLSPGSAINMPNSALKLFVFVDSSFANNKDFSSQIGYVIVMATETVKHTELSFRNSVDGKKTITIKGNILHWSSIKCKRVTRSVLASELYAMVHGFDMGIALKTTVERILKSLSIPLVICTDSRSLYDCLVKLGTTNEKRLMVDIMCLRQSYEKREIAEVRWINGNTNPADAMTKSKKACGALKSLVERNEVDIETMEWVERATAIEKV